jgi:hypothetical protein
MIDGLKIIRIIQSTDRFDAYEAELNGEKVFAKHAKTEKTKQLLAGLTRNSEAINQIGKESSIIKFRAPKIYQSDEESIVTEWIDGSSMNEFLQSDPQFVAEVLSKFFVVLDRQSVADQGFRQIFTKEGLAGRMDERIPKNLPAQYIQVLKQSKDLFDKLQGTLVPALQDADIKPEHVFLEPKNKNAYVLVDSEHLSNQWPRFFDLSNNFAKFWIRDQKDFSDLLLRTFLKTGVISKDPLFNPLLASLIVRGIALHWETDYDPGAKDYNIPRSQKMLEVCLAASNLDDLLY